MTAPNNKAPFGFKNPEACAREIETDPPPAADNNEKEARGGGLALRPAAVIAFTVPKEIRPLAPAGVPVNE